MKLDVDCVNQNRELKLTKEKFTKEFVSGKGDNIDWDSKLKTRH